MYITAFTVLVSGLGLVKVFLLNAVVMQGPVSNVSVRQDNANAMALT
jgi:sRNA-binding regulator protein Hfq